LVPNTDENIQQNNESSLPSQNVTLSNTPYGNSISNLVNCAKVAYYDGWVYVSYGSTFKMKPDGSQRQHISDRWGDYINVTSEGIFFSDRSGGYRGSSFIIVRMNHDGTNIQQLNRQFSHRLTVKDDWVFYTAPPDFSLDTSPDSVLYRMKTDGSQCVQICNHPISRFLIVNDEIFYLQNHESESRYNIIYEMDIDGSKGQLFYDLSVESLQYQDGWLYFINREDEGRLYRLPLKDKKPLECIVSVPYINEFAFNGGWIYYTIDDPNTYAIEINGDSSRKISERRGVHIGIAGNHLYCEGGRYVRDCVLDRIPLSGGDEELVVSFTLH